MTILTPKELEKIWEYSKLQSAFDVNPLILSHQELRSLLKQERIKSGKLVTILDKAKREIRRLTQEVHALKKTINPDQKYDLHKHSPNVKCEGHEHEKFTEVYNEETGQYEREDKNTK